MKTPHWIKHGNPLVVGTLTLLLFPVWLPLFLILALAHLVQTCPFWEDWKL